MAIPTGTKFHGVAPDVSTKNLGSTQANTMRDVYTIEEIAAAAGGGLFEENITGGPQSTQRVGSNNSATGTPGSTVSGGAENTASNYASTVSGGLYNTSSGPGSTVGGGVVTLHQMILQP